MCQTMLVLYFRHYLFCIHVVILTLTTNLLQGFFLNFLTGKKPSVCGRRFPPQTEGF